MVPALLQNHMVGGAGFMIKLYWTGWAIAMLSGSILGITFIDWVFCAIDSACRYGHPESGPTALAAFIAFISGYLMMWRSIT